MKFFAIFAAVCAVASAGKGWTLIELSSAVSSPYTDAAFKPSLEQALNYVMENIFTSDNYAPIAITTAAGVSGHYNMHQLESLLKPDTNPVYLPYVEEAFVTLIDALNAGEEIQTVPVMIPALDITYMTLNEIDVALASPATNPALVPYLEYYLNQYMDALFSGHQIDGLAVAVPSGLGAIGGVAAPAPAPVVVPSPAPVVVPSPVVPSPVVPAPVVPAPETPASSPLVQIILNVRKEEDLEVAAPVSPITPSPVGIAPVQPQPIQIVEQPIDKPTPVQIVEQPIIVPSPIQIVEQPIPVNPIDAILMPIEALPMPAPSPIQVVEQPIPVNPIDAILMPIEALPIPAPSPIQVVEQPAQVPVNPIDAVLMPIEALPLPAPEPIVLTPY